MSATVETGQKVMWGGEEVEVLYAYSRAQAIEDGVLVDVSALLPDMVANAGIKFPVAMTNEVWTSYVEVPKEVQCQDLKGRLWDILYLFRIAARRFEGDTLLFQLHVRNDNRRPKLVTLKAVVGPGDQAEPVITISMPDQRLRRIAVANWKFRLDMKDLWAAFEAKDEDARYDETEVNAIGKAVSGRIREAPFFLAFSSVLDPLADEFAEVQDIDDFDGILSRLYDWGDRDRCWIATSF